MYQMDRSVLPCAALKSGIMKFSRGSPGKRWPSKCWRGRRLGFRVALILAGLVAPGLHAATEVTSNITESVTWTIEGSPYIVDRWNELDVYTDSGTVTLTIEAGVEVLLKNTRKLTIGNNAALVIAGTETDPVVFDHYDNGNEGYADWRLVYSTNRSNFCIAEHAIFRNGGYPGSPNPMVVHQGVEGAVTFRHCQFKDSHGKGLSVQRDCAVKVDSCTFADNGGPGIWMDRPSDDQTLNTVRNCRFENQDDVERAAIEVQFHGGGMPALSGNSGSNGTLVLVDSINVDISHASMRWQVPGQCDDGTPIPYVIDEVIFYDAPEGEPSTLTIDPGNVIELRGAGFDFGPRVALHAQGTAENPIYFTHTDRWNDENPTWRRVSFHEDSMVTESVFEYLIFAYGGASSQGVIIWDNDAAGASLRIENCTFRHSQDHAIFVDQDWDNDGTFGPLYVTGCQFEQNTGCDIRIRGADSDGPGVFITDCRFEHGYRWTTAAIRTSNPRLVFSGTNTATEDAFVYFDDPNGELTSSLAFTVPGTLDGGGVIPYVLTERWTLQVPDESGSDVTVRIDPGCVFRFQTFPQQWSPKLAFGRNVTAIAEGTEAMPILFEATERWDSDNAHWTGIRLEEDARGSGSVFSHVIVKDADTGLRTHAPGTVQISHSLFEDNDTGVELGGGSAGAVSECRFDNNKTGLDVGDSGGSHQEPVPVSIGACVFHDNDTGLYFGSPAEGTAVLESSFSSNNDYAIRNARRINVDAHTCDFGHTSGPLDDSDDEDTNYDLGYTYYNPEGRGDPVSDDVRYGADTDDDGIEDSWEILHFGDLTSTDGEGDFDNDGLKDRDEFSYRTDPKNRDSDGDGFADGAEVNAGLDPATPHAELFTSAVTTLQNDADLRASLGLCETVEGDVAAAIAADPDKMADYGLYTEAVLKSLHGPAPLLRVDGGSLHLTLQLQANQDFDSAGWEPMGNPVQWTAPVTDDTLLYRILLSSPE